MGQKSGRNGAPAPQSRVSLSESKPEADFCLLECVRSFLAERSTANPEEPPARNSVRIPEGRNPLPVSTRRGLLGFAGLAPHSGRSSVPFRRAMFRDRRYPSNYTTGQKSP